MIVWSGQGSNELNTGGRYSPASNTWAATSTGTNVPVGRTHSSALWTGAKMLVWGGFGFDFMPETGANYDPVRDLWSPISSDANTPTGAGSTLQYGPVRR